MPEPSSASRTALLGLTDQGVYSVTNLALALVVAQNTTAREFGSFSAVFVGYTLLAGVVEALSGETYIVHHSAGTGSKRHAQSAVTGFAAVLGLVCGLLALGIWLAYRSETTDALAAFAVVIPFLLVQNAWRSVLFASGRAGAALVNDLTWAVVQLVAVTVVVVFFEASVPLVVLAWGAGAVVAAVLGIVQTGSVPDPFSAVGWVRDHGRSSGAFGAEFVSLYGASQLVIAAVGAFAGLEELARLRVAQLIFGPLNVVVNGARVAATPIVAQRYEVQRSTLRPAAYAVGGGLAAISAGWGIVVLALPEGVWSRAFGDSWEGAAPLLVPFAINRVLLASSFGAVIGMRVLKAIGASLQSRTASAVLAVVLGGGGGALAGAEGAAWGLLGAAALGAGLMWLRFGSSAGSR